MKDIIENFFQAYQKYDLRAVYVPSTPKEMMASGIDEWGWYTWKLIPGTLEPGAYHNLAARFGCTFPDLFIEWHRRYYFVDCDCSLASFPASLPNQPLKALEDSLAWDAPKELIRQGFLPFAHEGNDAGLLVLDTSKMKDDDCPVYFSDVDYVGELEGISGPVFSSFEKMLLCFTQFLKEQPARPRHEIISDFFILDPEGAGKSGRAYWRDWIEMERETDERQRNDPDLLSGRGLYNEN